MNPLVIIAIIIAFILFYSFLVAMMVKAAEPEKDCVPDAIEMEATAYCYGTLRCDGGPVREGICAAAPKYYGKTAIVFEKKADGDLGEFLGYFEVLDTGGDERIQNGDVIDIYHPSEEWCRQFGRKKVYVRFVDGKG